MKEITLNGNGDRKVPKTVHQECIWVVRDYERLCNLAERGIESGRFGPYEIVLYADDAEGLIPSRIVENAMFRVNCIHMALGSIPMEYRKGIMDNITKRTDYPFTASRNTWEMWKSRFIKDLARRLEIC